jgi:hypothetical protein
MCPIGQYDGLPAVAEPQNVITALRRGVDAYLDTIGPLAQRHYTLWVIYPGLLLSYKHLLALLQVVG